MSLHMIATTRIENETLKMKKKKKSYHQRIILRKGIWNLNVILMQENVKVKVRTKLINEEIYIRELEIKTVYQRNLK